MSQNGNHSAIKAVQTLKVGLFNNTCKKYLTAESFGKINVGGAAMKKKQIWSLVQDADGVQNSDKVKVYMRSPNGRYITSDKHFNVTEDTENEEIPEGQGFYIQYSPDGRWAFEHETQGNLLGADGQNVKCYDKPSKDIKDQDLWSIQLDMHPQINLKNKKRDRYAVLNKESGNLECKETIPWGADALVMLEFSSDDGTYSLKSCDNQYLSFDGTLLDTLTSDARFTLELHSGALAFKDAEGRYLTAVGQGTMKTRNKKVTKDELFMIQDSHPQVQIISQSKKSVSIKQGVDVSANQPPEMDQLDDTEIFQMEYNKDSSTWAFVTHKSKYWTFKPDVGTIEICSEKSQNSLFTVEWNDDGTVRIKAPDGKYMSNRPTGILFSNNVNSEDPANKFIINIVNRPFLVLKGEHGFVGRKTEQLVCNTHKFDTLMVKCNGDGTYQLKGTNGQFLAVDDSNTVVFDQTGTNFQFRFCGNSQLAIRVATENGNFLKGEQNGQIKATATEPTGTSLWEF